MEIARMMVLSLFIGAVGAGLVWFACDAIENLVVLRQARKTEQMAESQESEDSEAEDEPGIV